METEQKESGKKNIMIGVIAALLLIVCVTLYFVYEGNQQNVDLTAQKTLLDTNFKNLSDTLDARGAEIDRMTSQNVRLDSTITSSQAMIASEKKQIAGLLAKAKMTKSELADAKTLIEQYSASIADLQKKVADLIAQNQQLTKDNGKLSDDLSTEKRTTAELNQTNKGLSKQVEIGSLLQLAKVDVDGIKERQNGKETTVKNSKAVESIRIGFETGANKVLPKGPLSLYVRVINPKGETMTTGNQGVASLQLAESDKQVNYSKKADIDWTQASKRVEVYCKQGNSTSGTYKVEIYQSGYLIGKGEVKFN
jgi:cell division protein FtsB